jgi:protein crumbs
MTGNNFTCFCTEGMEGPLCDTPFCLRRPCDNGSCNTTNEVPFCQCVRGFEGQFCEINTDDCVAPTGESPCQNGGICTDGVNRYDCNCTGTGRYQKHESSGKVRGRFSGYSGLLCEVDIDECQQSQGPCGPQGMCENMPGTYRCLCADKNKCGHFCELDNPCESVRPCVQGKCLAHCTDRADYVCECHEDYTGKNCSDHKVGSRFVAARI